MLLPMIRTLACLGFLLATHGACAAPGPGQRQNLIVISPSLEIRQGGQIAIHGRVSYGGNVDFIGYAPCLPTQCAGFLMIRPVGGGMSHVLKPVKVLKSSPMWSDVVEILNTTYPNNTAIDMALYSTERVWDSCIGVLDTGGNMSPFEPSCVRMPPFRNTCTLDGAITINHTAAEGDWVHDTANTRLAIVCTGTAEVDLLLDGEVGRKFDIGSGSITGELLIDGSPANPAQPLLVTGTRNVNLGIRITARGATAGPHTGSAVVIAAIK